MIRLSTLGPTELRRDSGEDLRPVLVQPKRLGLLAYLAVEAPGRFVRRDSLLALFWPELDEPQARQALRSALYFLRQHLGEQGLTSRGTDEVGVNAAVVATDIVAFRAAAERGDAAGALALNRGEFLSGLHIPDSSAELEEWIGRTRLETTRQAASLAWALADREEAKHNAVGAALWGRRAHEIEPHDEVSLRRLMELLDGLGDTGGALRAYEEFAERLRAELGAVASPESRSLVARLRIIRPTPGPRAALDLPPARPAPQTLPQSPGPTARPRRRTTSRLALVGAVLAGLGLAGAAMLTGPHRAAPAELVEGPIVVAALRNETGDTALAIWGRYAGDWITQGLQAVGRVPVVPWPSALRASRLADSVARSGQSDPVTLLSRETGARTVITGSYYRVGDSIRLRADISLADLPLTGTSRLLWSVPAIAAVPDSIESAIRELRERLLGGIGVSTNPRFAGDPRLGRQPPRFAAFIAYERGTALFDRSKYAAAAAEYERAFGLDSTFMTPALGALIAYWNMNRYGRLDSLARVIELRRPTLTEAQDLELRGLEARMRGDGRATLEILRRTALVAPSTAATYNLALMALRMSRPREALEALLPLRSNQTYVNRWAPYWIYLAHAYHLVGRYDDALGAVRELKRRFPNRSAALPLAVASLAALGRTVAIDSVLATNVTPPSTYWSAGAALVIAGQELLAHGHAEAAASLLQRAETWLTKQLRTDPRNEDHREWLAVVRYQRGRWDEAGRLAEELGAEFPNRLAFQAMTALVAARAGDTALAARRIGESRAPDQGWHLAMRARIAAIAGDTDRVVTLLTEALDHGVPSFHWAHSDWWVDLGPLTGDARIRRLLVDGLD